MGYPESLYLGTYKKIDHIWKKLYLVNLCMGLGVKFTEVSYREVRIFLSILVFKLLSFEHLSELQRTSEVANIKSCRGFA